MKAKLLLSKMFTLGLIFTSSHWCIAQEKQKDLEKITIVINNSDTLVNGKTFNDLSEDEKVAWRTKIKPPYVNRDGAVIKITKQKTIKNPDSLKTWVYSNNDHKKFLKIEKDSVKNGVFYFKDSLRYNNFRMRDNADHIDWKMVHPKREMRAPNSPIFRGELPNTMLERPFKPNTNIFNYNTTDDNGFTTKISIRVEEPRKEELKEFFNVDETAINNLKVSDLILYPNFDKGNITLSLNTAAKSTIAITVLKDDGSTLFSNKKTLAGNNLQQELNLSKNGLYYLKLSAANKTYIRKIIKN